MIQLLVLLFCLFSFTAYAQEEISDDSLLEESSAPAASAEVAPKATPAVSAAKPSFTSEDERAAAVPVKKRKMQKKIRMTKKPRARRSAGKSFFWYGSLGYDLGGDIKFSKVQVESTVVPGFTTSSTFKTGGAIEIAGGFLSMRKNSWGYGANVGYQLNRKIKSVTIEGTTGGGGSSISTILLQGNGIYRTNNLFFPFGLNFNLPSYTKASGEPGTTKVKGDIGLQAGVGYLPAPSGLFYQGGITMIGIQAQSDIATETYTYKTAYLMAIGAKVGYLF